MDKTEKRLRARIKALKSRIEYLENCRDKIVVDRDRFREYFKEKFEWFVKLQEDHNRPNMQWLIVDMAKFLNRVDRWYWG